MQYRKGGKPAQQEHDLIVPKDTVLWGHSGLPPQKCIVSPSHEIRA